MPYLLYEAPLIGLARKYGAENNLDVVVASEFAHRSNVVQNMWQCDWAIIEGNVVGTGKDDNLLGVQVEHIGTEAH